MSQLIRLDTVKSSEAFVTIDADPVPKEATFDAQCPDKLIRNGHRFAKRAIYAIAAVRLAEARCGASSLHVGTVRLVSRRGTVSLICSASRLMRTTVLSGTLTELCRASCEANH